MIREKTEDDILQLLVFGQKEHPLRDQIEPDN